MEQNMNEETFENVEVQIDEAKIKALEIEIQEKSKELETKVYAVQLDEEALTLLKDYMSNEVSWNGLECIGVVEVNRILNGEVKSANNMIFLKAIEIQAIHYFVSKVSGKGLKDAIKYTDFSKKVSKHVNESLEKTKGDAMELNSLKEKLKAAMQGVDQ
jgi:hypothetical protein